MEAELSDDELHAEACIRDAANFFSLAAHRLIEAVEFDEEWASDSVFKAVKFALQASEDLLPTGAVNEGNVILFRPRG